MRSLILVFISLTIACNTGDEVLRPPNPDSGRGADAGATVDMQSLDAGTVADAANDGGPPADDMSADASGSPDSATSSDAGVTEVICEPHTFAHGGKQRGYILCSPSPLPAGAVPVVLGFHGGGGTAANWWNGVAMHERPEGRRFVMVYMQGCRDNLTDCGATTGSYQWNVEKPGDPRTTDDKSYTLAVIDRLETEHGVDVGKLFAMGHSLGGMFTYTLRCDYPDLFEAIAPMSATPSDGSCAATGDTSIYHVHGEADPNVPFDTGCCSRAQQTAVSPAYLAACDNLPRCANPANWWPRTLDGVHPFADLLGLQEIATDALGCSNTREQTADYTDCRELTGCRSGTSAEVCIAPGGEHSLGSIDQTFDYRGYVWSRFRRHL